MTTPPLAERHVVRSCTRRSHGRHPANQRATSARKVKSKPSPASLRLRGRGKMPDAKSGRVHILRQLAIPGGVAAEDTGNHLLLSVTGRSECCRSGSEVSRAGLYQRQGAKGRCRSMEGGWLFNDLKKESRRPAWGTKSAPLRTRDKIDLMSILSPDPAKYLSLRKCYPSRMPVLRQNSTTAEPAPCNMLHSLAVSWSFKRALNFGEAQGPPPTTSTSV